jgi:peptidoglycan/LPS O-acetylase OafA/YrhL
MRVVGLLVLFVSGVSGLDVAPRCLPFAPSVDGAVVSFGATHVCGGGFASADGTSCFKAGCNIDTWAGAEAACLAQGAHLARLDSAQESSFAHCLAEPTDTMLKQPERDYAKPEFFVWSGLNSRNITTCSTKQRWDRWRWAAEAPGKDWNSFEDNQKRWRAGKGSSAGPGAGDGMAMWATSDGQPNYGRGNERCAAIGGAKSEWYDLNCAFKLKYVCRLDNPPSFNKNSTSLSTAACCVGAGTTDADFLREPFSDPAFHTALAVIGVFGILAFFSALTFALRRKSRWLPRRPARGSATPPTPPGVLLLGVPLGARGGDELCLGGGGSAQQQRSVTVPAGLSPADTFTVPLEPGKAATAAPDAAPAATTTVQITLPSGAVPGQQLVVSAGAQQLAVTVVRPCVPSISLPHCPAVCARSDLPLHLPPPPPPSLSLSLSLSALQPPGASPVAALSFEVPLPSGPAAAAAPAERVRCCAGCFGCHRVPLADPADAVTCCGCGVGWPGPARALAKDQRRVPTAAFDGIRGFGALQVAVGHFFEFMRKGRDRTEWGGGSAVLMFFIMSGFVMMLGYGGKGAGSGVQGCGYHYLGRNFLLRRIARMGPTVWLSLLVTIPLTAMSFRASLECDPDAKVSFPTFDGVPPSPSIMAIDYVATTMFMQTWIGMGAVNGPLWSVCAQMFCYLLFPMLVGPMHRYFACLLACLAGSLIDRSLSDNTFCLARAHQLPQQGARLRRSHPVLVLVRLPVGNAELPRAGRDHEPRAQVLCVLACLLACLIGSLIDRSLSDNAFCLARAHKLHHSAHPPHQQAAALLRRHAVRLGGANAHGAAPVPSACALLGRRGGWVHRRRDAVLRARARARLGHAQPRTCRAPLRRVLHPGARRAARPRRRIAYLCSHSGFPSLTCRLALCVCFPCLFSCGDQAALRAVALQPDAGA